MSALDELRFGSQRTLNLREQHPTAAEATRRTEAWLREHQVRGSEEVLIITGRGNQSLGGIAVLRPAIEKLLFSLRRRGVIVSHRDQNPGAFVVRLASLRSLVEAVPRQRDRVRRPAPAELHGLTPETTVLLRELAERSLHALGVAPTEARITDEMHRYLAVIVAILPPGPEMENELQGAIRAAISEFD